MSRVLYALAVESLMYSMICTRPDTAKAVGATSRFMENFGREHQDDVKRILRYIKGTLGVALCFEGSKNFVKGYIDSDFASDLDKRKSINNYVFTVVGGAVSQLSTLQIVMALSIREAEYMATTEACKEAIWIQRLIEGLGNNIRLLCIMTAKVPCTLQGIQLFIP